MNWTRIPKSVTSQNMTVLDKTKDYLFGISANMHVIKTHGLSPLRLSTISSGLVWETCIILPDNSKEISNLYFINILNCLMYNQHIHTCNDLFFIRSWQNRKYSGWLYFHDICRVEMDDRLC